MKHNLHEQRTSAASRTRKSPPRTSKLPGYRKTQTNPPPVDKRLVHNIGDMFRQIGRN